MKQITIIILLAIQLAYGQNDKAKMDWPNLQKYADENKNFSIKPPNTHRIVLMGDSITEFWKPNDTDFFIQTGYIDRGISGQTTQQMLLRFRQDVIQLQADVVVILAGINDIAENTGPISLENILGNIISMVELAKANKINVVLCSVLPANKFWWNPGLLPADKAIALNAIIKDYAHKNNLPYIDYYSAMVDDSKGLDLKWGDDGVHPNPAGYKLMEPLLVKAVTASLRKK